MATASSHYRSIAGLQNAIQSGQTTVSSVVKQYLDCIERLNGDLNAVTATNTNALQEADRLDRTSPDQRGPLFGVPILVKDQIATAGIRTTYGSKACKDYVPPGDAFLVSKLKAAGAVILGKTTMCDWAAGFVSASSLSGFTRHPIDPTRDPGGSSAGSGTAVAADMALVAIGGDTGGSIRLPSSFCGLVGVRPTPGRISRDGMSALLKQQDTPGPMCRRVEDAARLLDVLVGFDEQDDATSLNIHAGRTPQPEQFLSAIKQPFVEGKRLGVLRDAFGTHRGINTIMDSTLVALQSAGAELVDVEIPRLQQYLSSTRAYELRSKTDINAFLSSQAGLKHLRIEDLHARGECHPALPLIPVLVKGPTDPLQSPHYAYMLSQRDEFQRVVASVFARHDLDAIVYPTSQALAPKTKDVMDGFTPQTNTVIASQLLWTAVSVPIGTARDDDYPDDPLLPVGLEILGVPLSEARILNLAAAVEGLQEKR